MATGGRGTFGPAHDSQSSADHAPDRLSRPGVLGEGAVVHRLANLELLRRVTRVGGNGFVDVRGHGED